MNSQPTFIFSSVVSLCLKDNTFDQTKNAFYFILKALTVSAPRSAGGQFSVPNFEKRGIRKKMSTQRDLKSSYHGYLPAGPTIFIVKKKTENMALRTQSKMLILACVNQTTN